jgi:GH43 family beta-xylosidase
MKSITLPDEPLYDGYCADPFVLRVEEEGTYYAFGTSGDPGNNRRFCLLRSTDFIHWEFLGGALIPPDDKSLGNQFWAPEVARGDDGRFYLYYSVGHAGEMGHQLRVAVSDVPQGPYQDAGGKSLVDPARVPFAIDAHPFRDTDGQWYLFYAQDFLDTDGVIQPGTALIADRMLSMTELAGEEVVILRAQYPWQRFQKDRVMSAYGGQVFDWHTLEGAFVLHHDNRYWCLYSGAAYGTPNYGVDYGVADNVLGPYSGAGSEEGPRFLRTNPGGLRGPGHNSVTIGPDGLEYVFFHAWDDAHTKRQMYVRRLIWTSDGPRVAGITTDTNDA